MDSCSLFLFLSTFLGGYDLYIISTEYYPLKLERATGPKGRSCEWLLKYSSLKIGRLMAKFFWRSAEMTPRTYNDLNLPEHNFYLKCASLLPALTYFTCLIVSILVYPVPSVIYIF